MLCESSGCAACEECALVEEEAAAEEEDSGGEECRFEHQDRVLSVQWHPDGNRSIFFDFVYFSEKIVFSSKKYRFSKK